MSTLYDHLPLRLIRYPWPVCWDTRQAIEAHLQRIRIGRLLAAARSRPQLLAVPAVNVSPGR